MASESRPPDTDETSSLPTEQPRKRGALWIILAPYAIVAVGLFTCSTLVSSAPTAKKKESLDSRPLVKVEEAHVTTHPLSIRAFGTVVPAMQVTLQAEVGGRVIWQSDELIPGGRFAKGDKMVRIDPRNYQAALQQQNAQLGRTKMEYELEQGRQEIAQREWKILGSEGKSDLALRGPQVRTAEANLEAAQSGLKLARLDLSRTTLEAPFDAIVQSETVDVGQLVAPQAGLATLAGTERAWVQVSVPTDRLRWIGLDGFGSVSTHPEAVVHYESGGVAHTRTGKVTRLLGDLDPSGRMARLLVEVEDPLSLIPESHTLAPVFFGSYVEVEIKGQTLKRGVRIPRRALREGNQLYLAKDGKLEIRKVTPAWRESKAVILQEGVREGERYITSRIPTAVPGMKLRTVEDASKNIEGRKQEGSIKASPLNEQRRSGTQNSGESGADEQDS